MALTHETAVRNAIANLIDDQVNAGTTDTGGDIVIRDGTTTLVVIEFSDPAFGAAASGEITLNGTPLSGTATAGGTADNFQIRSRDNTLLFSGTVSGTGGGGDLELDNTSIAIDQQVNLTSLSYAAPA